MATARFRPPRPQPTAPAPTTHRASNDDHAADSALAAAPAGTQATEVAPAGPFVRSGDNGAGVPSGDDAAWSAPAGRRACARRAAQGRASRATWSASRACRGSCSATATSGSAGCRASDFERAGARSPRRHRGSAGSARTGRAGLRQGQAHASSARRSRTAQAAHERLTKTKALAVLSSDALSSVAYATEEILHVLLLAGLAALALSLPIGAAHRRPAAHRRHLLPADDQGLPARRRLLHRRQGQPRASCRP